MKTFFQYLREYVDDTERTTPSWKDYQYRRPNNETHNTEPVTDDIRTPPPKPSTPNAQGLRPIAGSIKPEPNPTEDDTANWLGVRYTHNGHPVSRIYDNPDNPAVPPPGQNLWASEDRWNARRFLENPVEGKVWSDKGNKPSEWERYRRTNPHEHPQRYPHETGDEYRARLNRGATIFNPNPAPGDAPDKYDYEGIGVSDKATAKWRAVEKSLEDKKAQENPRA